MRPFKRALERVRNLLLVISDPASQARVVLGHIDVAGACDTHRCVLGWYNYLYRPGDPFDFDEFASKKQFGIDSNTYVKIFGVGSKETNDPEDVFFDEDKTRREMRKRIRVIDEVIAGT